VCVCVCVCVGLSALEKNPFPLAESPALNDGLISLSLWIICAYVCVCVCVGSPLSLSSQALISSCHKQRIGDNPSYKGSRLAFHLSGCLSSCLLYYPGSPGGVTGIEIKRTQSNKTKKKNLRRLGNLCRRDSDGEFDGSRERREKNAGVCGIICSDK